MVRVTIGVLVEEGTFIFAVCLVVLVVRGGLGSTATGAIGEEYLGERGDPGLPISIVFLRIPNANLAAFTVA